MRRGGSSDRPRAPICAQAYDACASLWAHRSVDTPKRASPRSHVTHELAAGGSFGSAAAMACSGRFTQQRCREYMAGHSLRTSASGTQSVSDGPCHSVRTDASAHCAKEESWLRPSLSRGVHAVAYLCVQSLTFTQHRPSAHNAAHWSAPGAGALIVPRECAGEPGVAWGDAIELRTSARLQTRPQSAFLDCRRADRPSWSCQRRLGASVLAVQPPARVRARALTSHSAAVSIVQHRWGRVSTPRMHARNYTAALCSYARAM